MKTNTRCAAGGFTLVEMLVVVAIIGILMAMIVPGISKARERARRVKCAAHLKQLHAASVNYATDHGGRYPYAASCEHLRRGFRVWTKWHHGWVDWHDYDTHPEDEEPSPEEELVTQWWGDWGRDSIRDGSIFPYIKDERIYLCPTFQRHMKFDKGIPADYRDVRRSYIMNGVVSGILTSNLGADRGGMSRRMLFADAAYDTSVTGAEWSLIDDGDHTPFEDSPRWFYRGRDGKLEWEREAIGHWHDGRANVVFLDGHVERVHYTATEDICKGDWGE